MKKMNIDDSDATSLICHYHQHFVIDDVDDAHIIGSYLITYQYHISIMFARLLVFLAVLAVAAGTITITITIITITINTTINITTTITTTVFA